MTSIMLDSGSMITLALNNLLWLLEKVKKEFNIRFYITEPVKKEIIDKPLTTKRFKYEALQVSSLVKNKVVEVLQSKDILEKTAYLLEMANTSFQIRDVYISVVHEAEMSAVAAAILYEADAVMIDERTTRYLLEKPEKLRNVLMHKLHTRVIINSKSLSDLKKETKSVKFIRSAEFVAIAFEKGLLNSYLPNTQNSKEILLDALLWGLKLTGCAISERDLETLKREELKYIESAGKK
jgi:predicted nucleic acid-binding protein